MTVGIGEAFVGRIVHYYPRINVGVLKLTDGEINLGDVMPAGLILEAPEQRHFTGGAVKGNYPPGESKKTQSPNQRACIAKAFTSSFMSVPLRFTQT